MITEHYKEALKKEPQMLIGVLIKEITLFNDKMIIEYTSPIETSPDGSRGFLLYFERIKLPLFGFDNKARPIDYVIDMRV